MAKKKKVVNHDEDLIASLATASLSDIEGIAPINDADKAHFQVYISENKVFVDVNINAVMGYKVPELAYVIQTRLKKDIERRTRYTVERVNVNIIGVIIPL